jgi:hypothetical protein
MMQDRMNLMMEKHFLETMLSLRNQSSSFLSLEGKTYSSNLMNYCRKLDL